ncbi:GNAT family N-acetyltransferase [Streptomyces sp. NPDC090132]|uniref:GNAT family N-acetyltransferase n=1 Tax=Streptomyces sp. NPDC090132 TaxID=3365955 RepID=UPI0038001F76
MSIDIRPFQPFDLPGMYRVCLRTGDSGRDATGLYGDPDLLPHIYAGPYPAADPGLTFVAADASGVLGYVVATADSHAFDGWLEEHWWPELRLRYPLPLPPLSTPLSTPDPGDGTKDRQCVEHIHRPGPPEPKALYERYPAHLHIDILPRGQGAGLGRRRDGDGPDAAGRHGPVGTKPNGPCEAGPFLGSVGLMRHNGISAPVGPC